MKRVGPLAGLLVIVMGCGVGGLSDSEREWCRDNRMTVYRAGARAGRDMREWTEGTQWPLHTRPEYIRACSDAFRMR